MALLIPMEPRYSKEYFAHKMRWLNALMLRAASHEDFPNEEQRFYLRRMHDLSSNSVGMSYRLEHGLAPYVTFLIMPVFALANAGVEITSLEYLNIFHYSPEIGSIGMGVFFGLVLGKPLGIFLASWGAVRTGLAELPEFFPCLSGMGMPFPSSDLTAASVRLSPMPTKRVVSGVKRWSSKTVSGKFCP